MTGSQIATAFGAKRIGKGKWIARCTAHSDKKPSLSIDEGKKGVVLCCMSNHCDVREIVANAGLKMHQLFYHSRDFSSEALQAHLKKQAEDMLYLRERRLMDLRMVLKAVELKPYQRAKRCTSYFERDIEAMCQRLSQ
jgi:hypothetical protein